MLLPLSLLLALLFMAQGVIQNFDAYRDVRTLEPLTYAEPAARCGRRAAHGRRTATPLTEPATTQTQTLAMGPVASQEAIKMLGTNGGGFFNANSAHPYENPTPLDQFRADDFDVSDSRGAVLRVRPHGRRPAPGLGAALRR